MFVCLCFAPARHRRQLTVIWACAQNALLLNQTQGRALIDRPRRRRGRQARAARRYAVRHHCSGRERALHIRQAAGAQCSGGALPAEAAAAALPGRGLGPAEGGPQQRQEAAASGGSECGGAAAGASAAQEAAGRQLKGGQGKLPPPPPPAANKSCVSRASSVVTACVVVPIFCTLGWHVFAKSSSSSSSGSWQRRVLPCVRCCRCRLSVCATFQSLRTSTTVGLDGAVFSLA